MAQWKILLAAVALAATSAAARADNFMNLILTRTDDFQSPGTLFSMNVDVELPDVAGVSGIDISTAGGGLFSLQPGGPTAWHTQAGYADLPTMSTALDGAWTITISGDTPSSSSFSLDGSSLQQSEFFQTATGLSPASGAINVPANTSLSWVAPPNGANGYWVFVNIDGNNNWQDDDSVSGSLSPIATSWPPPTSLSLGFNGFTVGYYNVDAAWITALTVNSGSMLWGDSPYSPDGYPAQTSLLALGSETTVGFDVVPEPPSSVLMALGVIAIVFARRRLRRITRSRLQSCAARG